MGAEKAIVVRFPLITSQARLFHSIEAIADFGESGHYAPGDDLRDPKLAAWNHVSRLSTRRKRLLCGLSGSMFSIIFAWSPPWRLGLMKEKTNELLL